MFAGDGFLLITEVNVMFLNLWRHATYAKHSKALFGYINELLDYSEFYLKKRYGLEVKAHFYYPYLIPKNGDDLRRIDGMFNPYMGKSLQMFVGYGIDFKDDDGFNFAGYCACHGKGVIQPNDLCWAEMQPYTGNSIFLPSIYAFYAEFSRVFFHEIDHQILQWQGDPRWSSGVHRAKKKPLEYWQKSTFGYNQVFQTMAKENKTTPYFAIQIDPRIA